MASIDVRAGGQGDGASDAPARRSTRASRWAVWRRYPWLGDTLARLLDRYPELPAAPTGLWARAATGLVTLLAAGYVVFFTTYLWAQHDAYLTHAEDLGIMVQALWNTGHDAVLHQTICNSVSDTNCLGDISRLAIHFEPIMFPLAVLYALAPSPKTLQLVQTLVVASGAFPAFWIARRRLRSPFAGVAFAAVYLLYPTLQAAVTYDFHAVTLSAAFLMFALYFMLTRNTVGLITACLLALTTKEQIVVDVAMIGLSVWLFQRRWRVGVSLVALSVVWLVVELVVMHIASPLGHSPTASRYDYLGNGPVQAALYLLTHPVQVVREHVLDPGGVYYLRSLLSPAAYLPLLSPLTLAIAAPALAINLLSSSAAMRSGLYQYNADIVPVLVLAAIETIALVAWASQRLAVLLQPTGRRSASDALERWRARATAISVRGFTVSRVVVLALVLLTLIFSLREQRAHGYLPLAHGFTWPQQTAHTRIADDLLTRIPPEASVSAQTELVPHVSQRRFIYQYPYGVDQSDIVFLDVTGDFYPFPSPAAYAASVQSLLAGGSFHVVAAQDGYLLLAKGSAPPLDAHDRFGLPASFYTFTALPADQAAPHALDIRFGQALELVGYDVSPTVTPDAASYVAVTTYWRVGRPLSTSAAPQLVLHAPAGTSHALNDFAAVQWLPMSAWQPGTVMVMRTWPIFLPAADAGTLRLGMRVLGASGQPQPAVILSAGAPGAGVPALLNGGAEALFAALQVKG